MRELAKELVEAITAFDAECDITQHPGNIGDAWALLDYIRNKLEKFAGDPLTAEQIEDLAGSICDYLLVDSDLLRDVCLTYAKTFGAADYKGWFGKE